jgi:S-adenosylmethionine:tRNA ribosyltransferase-isomerase
VPFQSFSKTVSSIPYINPLDFRFDLPADRIPDRPLPERDLSKLLLYHKGEIGQTVFRNLSDFLPAESFLVFNNSKVIPARLYFTTENGATVELLCLQPTGPELTHLGENSQVWRCIVGNLKRWKEGIELKVITKNFHFSAVIIRRGGEENDVKFSWTGNLSFLEILEELGQIPLPPYMHRDADEMDTERYQTVYASVPGSVAAPTAGLHFTDNVMQSLAKAGYEKAYVTLHVGAGTFKPIKTENLAEHKMHEEFFEVDKDLIQKVLERETVIPVGTTSMRTLESMFHLGNQFLNGNEKMYVEQWAGFESRIHSKKECLNALLEWMQKHSTDKIVAETGIMIVPGYPFQICRGIVTNFHQPESTLVLLVAALVGENWRKIYDYALSNEFRFLSYGDSSLLIP